MIKAVPNQDWKYLDVLRRNVHFTRLTLIPHPNGLHPYRKHQITVTSIAAEELDKRFYFGWVD